MRIFSKPSPISVISTYIALPSCRNSEKINEQILRKSQKRLFWAPKCPVWPLFRQTIILPKHSPAPNISTYIALTSCRSTETIDEWMLRKSQKHQF